VDLQLAGRRAIVTGGSRGIGRAVAHSLLTEGVRVVIAARDAAVLEAAAADLSRRTRGEVVPVVTDTADDASVEALVERTAGALGGVDILVNSAAQPGGAGGPGGVAALPTDAAGGDLNIKVLGYLRTAKAVAPHFIAQGWGRIVNVGGLSTRQVGLASASMRNAAVTALTKTLSDELGRHGVTVNIVQPGLTSTDGYDGTFTLSEQARSSAGTGTAIGRVVTADEVAAVVTFLASPLSVAITGESISVGGGARGAIHY
jgi:NAD(P)-dependent dehydrogenase (short-subunit alcohol dehydrogenase family)